MLRLSGFELYSRWVPLKDRVRVIEEVFGRPLFVDPLRFSILLSSTETGTVVVDVLHKLAI